MPKSVRRLRPHRAPQFASVLWLTAGLLGAMVSALAALQRATGEVTAGDAHTAPQDATHHAPANMSCPHLLPALAGVAATDEG